MPKFSVVIPVYNVAPYLRECLDSVLAQTFTDWEAICVDDGSTDGSGAILEEYAVKDKRFCVIRQKNAGVSAARNVALDVARGEWIFLLDADDLIRSDTLRRLKKAIDQISKIDAVHLGVDFFTDSGEEWLKADGGPKQDSLIVFDAKDNVRSEMMGRGLMVFRKVAIGLVRYDQLVCGEDWLFQFRFMSTCEKILLCESVKYGYRQRGGSAVHSKVTLRKVTDAASWRCRALKTAVESGRNYDLKLLCWLLIGLVELWTRDLFKLSGVDCQTAIRVWCAEADGLERCVKLSVLWRFRIALCRLLHSQMVFAVVGVLPNWLKCHGFGRSGLLRFLRRRSCREAASGKSQ